MWRDQREPVMVEIGCVRASTARRAVVAIAPTAVGDNLDR